MSEEQTTQETTDETGGGANVPAVQQSQVPAQVSSGNLTLNEDQLAVVASAIQENIDSSELQISRLAIMQPQSPEVTNDEQGYKKGQIVDNLTREIFTDLGKPPWLLGKVPDDELSDVFHCCLVPVFKLPSEYIKWIPKSEQEPGGDMWEFKTLDQKDPRVREGVWPPIGSYKGDKPPVTTNINMLCLIIDNQGLAKSSFVVATFARTSYNAGKQLVTACNQHPLAGLPYWGRCYYLSTKKEVKDIGGTDSVYYIYQVSKGPATGSLNPHIDAFAGKMALWLADKEEGKARQESLINAAAISDETGEEGAGGDDDPFASPPSGGEGGESQF